MTGYPRSAYPGPNPNAGYPANGDFAAWGGWQYPRCPPAHLTGTTGYSSASSGQTLRVSVRTELVPLWNLAFEIMDRIHHYPVWASVGGVSWGPWGGSCRAIANTQRPSGHSGWLSVDCNAPNNPYSARWQCDMPPPMVADLESLGFYWGGRYTSGRFDPMHYGYCRKPSDVAGSLEAARRILGQHTPTPTPPQEDDVTPEQCRAIVAEELTKALRTSKYIVTNDRASTPNDVPYSVETALERILRLVSGTFVGESGDPHN